MTIRSLDTSPNLIAKENLLISFNQSTLLKILTKAVTEIQRITEKSDPTVIPPIINLLKAKPFHKNIMTQSQGS